MLTLFPTLKYVELFAFDKQTNSSWTHGGTMEESIKLFDRFLWMFRGAVKLAIVAAVNSSSCSFSVWCSKTRSGFQRRIPLKRNITNKTLWHWTWRILPYRTNPNTQTFSVLSRMINHRVCDVKHTFTTHGQILKTHRWDPRPLCPGESGICWLLIFYTMETASVTTVCKKTEASCSRDTQPSEST